MKLLFVFTFYLMITVGQASVDPSQVFQDSWSLDYTPLACSDNVRRLYSRLGRPQNSWVLHIHHKSVPYVPIKPLKPRTPESVFLPVRWTFHAVLILENKVFDLDYANRPTPTQVLDYFDAMWNMSALESDYRFQIKKAESYTAYDADGDMAGVEELEYFELLNICIQVFDHKFFKKKFEF